MRALVYVTYTDCENKWRSLQAAGHEVHVKQYDCIPHDSHGELVDEAKRLRPDFAVLVGAVEVCHGRPVPRTDILRRIRDVVPFVHMCNDAADPPWWGPLQQYHDSACFSVQVNIDGARNTPIATFSEGLTLLTPVDSRVFSPRPWGERSPLACIVGGQGHSQRAEIVIGLQTHGQMDFFDGPVNRSYEDMAAIMCRYRFTVNHPMTGSGAGAHVKGRVVEAGFAGAVLIECADSPTETWFEKGVDYLRCDTVADVAAARARPDAEEVARRFHEKVVRDHHPKVFWDKVLQKAGVSA